MLSLSVRRRKLEFYVSSNRIALIFLASCSRHAVSRHVLVLFMIRNAFCYRHFRLPTRREGIVFSVEARRGSLLIYDVKFWRLVALLLFSFFSPSYTFVPKISVLVTFLPLINRTRVILFKLEKTRSQIEFRWNFIILYLYVRILAKIFGQFFKTTDEIVTNFKSRVIPKKRPIIFVTAKINNSRKIDWRIRFNSNYRSRTPCWCSTNRPTGTEVSGKKIFLLSGVKGAIDRSDQQ